MPVGATVGAAVVGAGSSLLSSGNQASAAEQAGQDTSQATEYAANLQNQQYQQNLALEMPGYRVGQGALGLYSTLLGLPGFSLESGGSGAPTYSATPGSLASTSGTTSTTAAASTPDYSAYLAANPDIASYVAANPSVVASKGGLAGYLQWHDQNYAGENRPSYTNPTTTTASGTGTLQSANSSDLQNLTGASDLSGLYSTIQNQPGYQSQLKQGLDAVQGSAAAAGSLNSGATLKALDTYGQNTFGNYYNQYLSNLGSLAGLGTSTANTISNQGTAAAANQGSLAVQGATATGQAGVNAANAWSSGLGTTAGTLSGLSSTYNTNNSTPYFNNGSYSYTGDPIYA